MKRIIQAIAAIAIGFTLSACGERVEIPSASVGMVKTTTGFTGDILPPSRFRLSPCFLNCDRLVVIEAGDTAINESYTIRMPQERMNIDVTARMTVSLSNDENELKRVFANIKTERLESGLEGTTLMTVYEVYAKAIVTIVVRRVITANSVDVVNNSQAAISEQIRTALIEEFKRTPMKIREFTLENIKLPDALVEAEIATQSRMADIAKADASAQVSIREAQAKLESSKAQREAELYEAETVAETNRKLAEGITPEVMRYLELQTMKAMAENKNTIFFPIDMMGSASGQGALMNRMLLKESN